MLTGADAALWREGAPLLAAVGLLRLGCDVDGICRLSPLRGTDLLRGHLQQAGEFSKEEAGTASCQKLLCVTYAGTCLHAAACRRRCLHIFLQASVSRCSSLALWRCCPPGAPCRPDVPFFLLTQYEKPDPFGPEPLAPQNPVPLLPAHPTQGPVP